MSKLSQSTQNGYVAVVVLVFMLLVATFLYPWKFPKSDFSITDGSHYCREFVTDPNPPTFDYNGVTYKLIKKNVPINPSGFQGQHHVKEDGNVSVDNKNYQILDPGLAAGRSYDFNTEDGKIDISFNDYGLIYLLHLDTLDNPEIIEIQNKGLKIIDIYQDIAKPPLPLAENILKCVDVGAQSIIDPTVLVPRQDVSPKKDQLQLEWFVIKQAKLLPKAWWTPECKPAIYLYPESEKLVNVRVFPKGQLSYTDPPYDPGSGWTVWAKSDGELVTMNYEPQTYNYLYYESKIRDEEIKKPETGWVVQFEELENLYNRILPKLGLNQKEKSDFIDYWLKTLPKSPYYFVGIVDKSQRDYLEPLAVTPAVQTSIRFSLYFEALDQPKEVEEPEIKTPVRSGFTLVDWGGMVKLHPGTPFTCSQ